MRPSPLDSTAGHAGGALPTLQLPTSHQAPKPAPTPKHDTTQSLLSPQMGLLTPHPASPYFPCRYSPACSDPTRAQAPKRLLHVALAASCPAPLGKLLWSRAPLSFPHLSAGVTRLFFPSVTARTSAVERLIRQTRGSFRAGGSQPRGAEPGGCSRSLLAFVPPPLLAMTPLCPHLPPCISAEQGLIPLKKLYDPPPELSH